MVPGLYPDLDFALQSHPLLNTSYTTTTHHHHFVIFFSFTKSCFLCMASLIIIQYFLSKHEILCILFVDSAKSL